MPRDPQDNKFIQCVSNFQDKSFHAEEALHGDGVKAAAARSEDVEVNIIDCTTVSDNEQNEARCDDAATESISSFGDTESKTKNGSSGLSDTEVESQLFVGGGHMSIFDGYGGSFKMRLIVSYLPVTLFSVLLDVSYLPFSERLLKENKKSATDGASIDDGYSNPAKTINDNDEFGTQDGWTSIQSRDSISEHILRQIEVLKSQVHKLKSRADKVASENPVKFSSVNNLSLLAPSNALTSSEQNPASVPKIGDRLLHTQTQHMSGCNMGFLMPETAISSHGEATSRSDMIENTGQPQGGVSCGNVRVSSVIYSLLCLSQQMSECNMGDLVPETAVLSQRARMHTHGHGKVACIKSRFISANAEEEILICNAAVKEFKDFDIGLAEKLLGVMEKQTVQASNPDLPEEMLVARVLFGGKSLPKSSNFVFALFQSAQASSCIDAFCAVHAFDTDDKSNVMGTLYKQFVDKNT
ncbi:hypothetical protein POTOM_021409 [Populus tomentosa]|uniref:Uncharacterized protein n=1 Tax=Populus tomentosa TaxID=118781 RepID=A0A8X7ZRU6_POPTO|nr:hypothetical protein POTOM_021409 [Populus tomentosa]